MKREIKFRAWDNKRMVYLSDLSIGLKKRTKKICPYAYFATDTFGGSVSLAKHELMQFTGLHDKNGKDIYEGDILLIQYFKITAGENLGISEIEAELLGVIEINPLALVLKNIVGKKWCEYTGYEQEEGECKVFHLHDVYEGSSDAEWQIEVIGNIYENPELIESK